MDATSRVLREGYARFCERLGVRFPRPTRPDAMYGFQDEVWWSRLAAPNLHAWTPDQPLRLVDQTVAKTDPDPKAIACATDCSSRRVMSRAQIRSGCAWSKAGR